MTTVTDAAGTTFVINDANGVVVQAMATNLDGSVIETQWDTQNQTSWVSRTEWFNTQGQITQAEVTFKNGTLGWELFAPDGSHISVGDGAGAMEPNSGTSVFADIISANLSGAITPMVFLVGNGQTSVGGVGVMAFGSDFNSAFVAVTRAGNQSIVDIIERIMKSGDLNIGEDVAVARLQGYRDGIMDSLGASAGLGAGELQALERQVDINVALGVAGM